jgi:hypothetical protein
MSEVPLRWRAWLRQRFTLLAGQGVATATLPNEARTKVDIQSRDLEPSRVTSSRVVQRKKITEPRRPHAPSFKDWVLFDLFGIRE